MLEQAEHGPCVDCGEPAPVLLRLLTGRPLTGRADGVEDGLVLPVDLAAERFGPPLDYVAQVDHLLGGEVLVCLCTAADSVGRLTVHEVQTLFRNHNLVVFQLQPTLKVRLVHVRLPLHRLLAWGVST